MHDSGCISQRLSYCQLSCVSRDPFPRPHRFSSLILRKENADGTVGKGRNCFAHSRLHCAAPCRQVGTYFRDNRRYFSQPLGSLTRPLSSETLPPPSITSSPGPEGKIREYFGRYVPAPLSLVPLYQCCEELILPHRAFYPSHVPVPRHELHTCNPPPHQRHLRSSFSLSCKPQHKPPFPGSPTRTRDSFNENHSTTFSFRLIGN